MIIPYDILDEQKADPFYSNVTINVTQNFLESIEDEDHMRWLRIAEHCVIRKSCCVIHHQREQTSHLEDAPNSLCSPKRAF